MLIGFTKTQNSKSIITDPAIHRIFCTDYFSISRAKLKKIITRLFFFISDTYLNLISRFGDDICLHPSLSRDPQTFQIPGSRSDLSIGFNQQLPSSRAKAGISESKRRVTVCMIPLFKIICNIIQICFLFSHLGQH